MQIYLHVIGVAAHSHRFIMTKYASIQGCIKGMPRVRTAATSGPHVLRGSQFVASENFFNTLWNSMLNVAEVLQWK